MRLTKIRENLAPIKIEQTTLIKYFPTQKINELIIDKKQYSSHEQDQSYAIILEQNKIIKIKETHCLQCGSRLVRNGENIWKVILDKWKGTRKFRILRKRCPNCGEINPNYSRLAPKNCNYHENFKFRARQHYMEGLTPPQIQKVFKIDFGIKISKSTIVRWINEISSNLRELLKNIPVPSSGYWGYDEIHMRIAGKKRYTIDTVDLNTKFVPVARITKNMGRDVGMKVLREGRKGAILNIKGMVKDCSTNLGALFKTRSFKNVKLQNCITHVKWIMARHVKVFVGMSSNSSKPLPKEWNWLLKQFYQVIDSNTETELYIKLEILRNSIQKLHTKRVSRLKKAFKQLEKWSPKIIAHQRDPFLASTNNLLESFHRKYTYYPSFKRHMMTERGAQRVLDYRVFGHNSKQFPEFIRKYKAKHKRWKALLQERNGDTVLRGQGQHFKGMFRKLDEWYDKYMEVWNQYFKIA